jgi:hypothetical protein
MSGRWMCDILAPMSLLCDWVASYSPSDSTSPHTWQIYYEALDWIQSAHGTQIQNRLSDSLFRRACSSPGGR